MSPKDRINQAEHILALFRQDNNIEHSDFEAVRNIVAISRNKIAQAAQDGGVTKAYLANEELVKMIQYLNDLTDQTNHDWNPTNQIIQINLADYQDYTDPSLSVSQLAAEILESDLESNLTSLIYYFDESFGNPEAGLTNSDLSLCEEEKEALDLFRKEVEAITYPDCMTELIELLSGFLSIPSVLRIFSQLFEINRVINIKRLVSDDLDTHLAEQDLLFNAFAEFRLISGFNLTSSPTDSITPISFTSLKLVINDPVLSKLVVNKMSKAIAFSWLRSGFEQLIKSYNENFIREVIEVSTIFAQASSDERQMLEIKYADHPLLDFFKHSVEFASFGDPDVAFHALSSVIYPHYLKIIRGSLNIYPYDMLATLHAISKLNPNSNQFRNQVHSFVAKAADIGYKEAQAADEILKLVAMSDIFCRLLEEEFEPALTIH